MNTRTRSDYRALSAIFVFVFSLLTIISIGVKSVLFSFVFGAITGLVIFIWIINERSDVTDLTKASSYNHESSDWVERQQSSYIGIDTHYNH